MSSTIDNISTNISTRFDSIDGIFQIYNQYDLDPGDEEQLSSSISRLTALRELYLSESLRVLSTF